MTIRPWPSLREATLLDYHVFHVREAVRRSPRTDREVGFFLIDTPDWVNVLPITPDGDIVMVRQYRQGTATVTLELPGGLIDPHERDPREAAARELREETGHVADRIEPLGAMSPNPAMMSNRCHAFVATGCRRAGELIMDPGEDIEVVTVPMAQLDALLCRGEIEHAIVLATIALWRARTATGGV